MELLRAQNAGFCFGVKKAVNVVTIALKNEKESIYTLGALIHNPQMMLKLSKKGLKQITNINILSDGVLVIPTHGCPKNEMNNIKEKKLKIIDTTCAFVKRAQNIVQRLAKNNFFIIVIGDANHPEVKSLISFADGKAISIENVGQIKKQNLPFNSKIAVVSQTTQTENNFNKIVAYLTTICPNLEIHNTICSSTDRRQEEVIDLAQKTNMMLVVGGKNSANTTRLAETCKKYQPRTYHIETSAEIEPNWFRKNLIVGITAGASTPDFVIEDIIKKIEKIKKEKNI